MKNLQEVLPNVNAHDDIWRRKRRTIKMLKRCVLTTTGRLGGLDVSCNAWRKIIDSITAAGLVGSVSSVRPPYMNDDKWYINDVNVVNVINVTLK